MRLPASYCGVLGMRPTHDRVSLDGAMLVRARASMWRAGSRATRTCSSRVGEVLLGEDASFGRTRAHADRRRRVCAWWRSKVAEALQSAVAQVAAQIPRRGARHGQPRRAGPHGWTCSVSCKAPRSGRNHGEWIDDREAAYRRRHRVAPGDRVEARARLQSRPPRREPAQRNRAARCPDRQRTMCSMLPTSPRIAPLKGTEQHALEIAYRFQAMQPSVHRGPRRPAADQPAARASLEGCPARPIDRRAARQRPRCCWRSPHRIMESTT